MSAIPRVVSRKRAPDITCSPAAFVVHLLERAEQAHSTELWSFGTAESPPLGEVLVSHGLVCLVALARGQITLGARLSQRHPETAAIVRKALSVARERGRPLGDILLEIGGVGAERIREALLDQIADGLSEIARAAPSGLIQVSRSSFERRLSSVLTGFEPKVVYRRTISRLLPAPEDAAVACHRAISPFAGSSTLCVSCEGELFPVETSGFDVDGVGSFAKLGQHVRQLASPPALLAAEIEPSMVMLTSADGPVLVVATARRAAMFGHFPRRGSGKAVSIAHGILVNGG